MEQLKRHVIRWLSSSLNVQAVVDLDSLVKSANTVEVDGGEKVEAMVGRYDGIEDYRTALAEHVALHRQVAMKASCLNIPVRTHLLLSCCVLRLHVSQTTDRCCTARYREL